MNLSRVVYTNAFKTTGLALSFTDTVGSEAANAFDWRDWSTASFPVGAATVEITPSASGTYDTLVLWVKATNAASTIQVHEETAPSVWTARSAVIVLTAGIKWIDLTAFTTANELRLTITSVTTATVFRQITLGKVLEFIIGQWAGLTPAYAQLGVKGDTDISVNGSFLGRSTRRTPRSAEIKLTLLSQDWVRTYWVPFIQEVANHSFWWKWNPTKYPLEVAFCAAKSIDAPVNDTPIPRMMVAMSIDCLVD